MNRLSIRLAALGLVGLGAVAAALTAPAPEAEICCEQEPQDPPKKSLQPPKRNEAIIPAEEIRKLEGARLSAGKTYDNQPACAETPEGTTWVAYVRYANRGADEVVAVSRKDGKVSEPRSLTEPGQYVRPALAAQGNDAWCVWTRTEPARVASVWYSRLSNGAWTPAARLVPEETRAHQNPEIAAAPDGRVAVAYQVHTGKVYDIHLRTFDGREWSSRPLNGPPDTNHWDPSVAFDAKGRLHVVWCGFQDGDYDVFWTRDNGVVRRLSSRGEYDLHPWIAAAPDGTVWATWDVVDIPAHGNSGRTTITGESLKNYHETDHGRLGIKSSVEVRVLDGDDVRLPGKPRDEIVAPKGYRIAHTGLPKVAFAGGAPWVFYRILRREANSPGIGYFWELVGRPFGRAAWGEPVKFGNGDGYLEEPGLASGPSGIRVAYGGEHRKAHIPKPAPAKKAAEAEAHDHHRDFDASKGWNGEVFLASVAAEPAGAAAELPLAPSPKDQSARPRPRIEPYKSTGPGKPYALLWGDTHRHSNVSRCSQGNEPSPDDLYRYGHDICRYDWFALSDHAEDPRQTGDVIDYYWWKQQKLSDLYHVPHSMSVLYNYEWSLTYPHGHHNTIFPSRPDLRLDRSLAASSTLAGGWKLLEKNNLRALTIPHTGADPGMGTAWEVQDDRYQRLCEIFQACRGSYEHAGCPREYTQTANKKGYYWNALEKGYKVGVIASTDHGFGVSYACVYAPENTREAIWQAMWDRRTYGSTTYGLVLEVRSGERWMGEEWSQKEAPALEVYVRGSRPIRSVEILGRSKVLHAEGSLEKPIGAAEHRLRWTDPDWATQTAEQWYYVRVIQADDEMAWSSPVWVKPVR
jgi:hypothetical protein